MSAVSNTCPALVLNADYRPLSYHPLSLWSWRNALKAVFLGRVAVVSQYDREARSPSRAITLPSVIALKDYAPLARRAAFTRFNLFLRDHFTCQYCGGRLHSHKLTFDHVIPCSRGGGANWSNIVAACETCNLRKADQTPEEAGMPLLRKPFEPSARQLQDAGRRFPPNFLHESWGDYLYWDVELEKS